MRRYIRHPSDIPIEFHVEGIAVHSTESLHDVSYGGLSFTSKSRVLPGSEISITIRFVKPAFKTTALVKWCRKRGKLYDVGVAFCDPEDAYRARMIEQVCHIEHYKRETLEKEGRKLTGEQAASEWIKRFASRFPKIELQE
jgi:hypothetical protein